MAGFLDNIGLGGLKSRLSDLSRVGMKYEDLLIKNSQSIGFIESQLMQARGSALPAAVEHGFQSNRAPLRPRALNVPMHR